MPATCPAQAPQSPLLPLPTGDERQAARHGDERHFVAGGVSSLSGVRRGNEYGASGVPVDAPITEESWRPTGANPNVWGQVQPDTLPTEPRREEQGGGASGQAGEEPFRLGGMCRSWGQGEVHGAGRGVAHRAGPEGKGDSNGRLPRASEEKWRQPGIAGMVKAQLAQVDPRPRDPPERGSAAQKSPANRQPWLVPDHLTTGSLRDRIRASTSPDDLSTQLTKCAHTSTLPAVRSMPTLPTRTSETICLPEENFPKLTDEALLPRCAQRLSLVHATQPLRELRPRRCRQGVQPATPTPQQALPSPPPQLPRQISQLPVATQRHARPQHGGDSHCGTAIAAQRHAPPGPPPLPPQTYSPAKPPQGPTAPPLQHHLHDRTMPRLPHGQDPAAAAKMYESCTAQERHANYSMFELRAHGVHRQITGVNALPTKLSPGRKQRGGDQKRQRQTSSTRQLPPQIATFWSEGKLKRNASPAGRTRIAIDP